MPLRVTLVFVVALLLSYAPIVAEDEAKDRKAADKKEPAKSSDDLTQTQHTAKIGGQQLDYTVTAGTIVMREDDVKNKAKASVFFVAYTKNDEGDLSQRPISFCFNGGPGSSSVWLHLGMLAPWRVPMPDDASSPAPPVKLAPNPHSLLDKTDLVFVDPVSTGYSRPAEGQEKKQFHGFEEDLRSVGQFIHLYTTRYKRWQSPRYLIGESYGSLRAAGLAGHLQDRYNMDLNGLVLVSTVLDFRTLSFEPTNDLPSVLFLPSYTATAWYHKRLPADLQKDLKKTLAKVQAFAVDEYAPALFKGDSLGKTERKLVAQKLARFTGLSPEYVEQCNLRVSIFRFAKELLRDERRTIGRFDSRYIGIDRDAAGSHTEYDPSAAAIFSPFTSALYHYLREDLKVERDVPYEILTSKVRPWNYDPFRNRYVNVVDTLRKAMTKNPHLKVFVANGYYDLATPYFATVHTFDHLGLAPGLRKNVQMGFYSAGHMMYVHGPSLKRLKKDLAAFYDGEAE